MKTFFSTILFVLGGGACAVAGAAAFMAATSCGGSPGSPQLDGDQRDLYCDLLLGSDGKKKIGIPTFAGALGCAPVQPFSSPAISSSGGGDTSGNSTVFLGQTDAAFGILCNNQPDERGNTITDSLPSGGGGEPLATAEELSPYDSSRCAQRQH